MHAALLFVVASGMALIQKEPHKVPQAEAKPKPAAGESATALEDFKTDAGEYVIRLASRPDDKLKLHDESLLAREFSARMEDQNGQKSDLRLISQPLIRYELKNNHVHQFTV